MTREEFLELIFTEIGCVRDVEDWARLYDDLTTPHWISVEDELPPLTHKEELFGFDYSDKVLVLLKETDADGMMITFAECNRDHPRVIDGDVPKEEPYWSAVKSCDMYEGFGDNITHWMPLPQAPTVAKNATVKEKGGEHDTEK